MLVSLLGKIESNSTGIDQILTYITLLYFGKPIKGKPIKGKPIKGKPIKGKPIKAINLFYVTPVETRWLSTRHEIATSSKMKGRGRRCRLKGSE